MKKKLTLWQKIQIKYQFHWMDTCCEFCEIAARPTWYLTHTQEQIDRRLAAFEVKMEEFRRQKAETAQKLQQLVEELKREKLEREQSQSDNRLP